MADGTTSNIENIMVGDSILSVNIATMKIEKDIVDKIESPMNEFLVVLQFQNSISNTNTLDHPYFVKNKGLCSYSPEMTLRKYGIAAKQLEEGDVCFIEKNGELAEIRLLSMHRKEKKQIRTYNLSSVRKNHNFFANGILVHNKR
jgi:hypothetical protein